jgi:hypothetical protein
MTHLFLVALTAVTLNAADATGTWTGTLTPAGGDNRNLPAHLVLKQEGTTLTGTAGADASEQRPIRNGKVEDGTLTFELPNDETVMKFKLKLDGDEIAGDVTREREGQTQMATLSVKRAR